LIGISVIEGGRGLELLPPFAYLGHDSFLLVLVQWIGKG